MLYGFVATLAKVVINRVGNEIAGVTGGGTFEWLTIVCIVGLLLAAALGAYFVQTAYSVGSPDLVIAGLTVVDPLVAVAIGIAVLGEAAQVPLWALFIWIVAAGARDLRRLPARQAPPAGASGRHRRRGGRRRGRRRGDPASSRTRGRGREPSPKKRDRRVRDATSLR